MSGPRLSAVFFRSAPPIFKAGLSKGSRDDGVQYSTQSTKDDENISVGLLLQLLQDLLHNYELRLAVGLIEHLRKSTVNGLMLSISRASLRREISGFTNDGGQANSNAGLGLIDKWIGPKPQSPAAPGSGIRRPLPDCIRRRFSSDTSKPIEKVECGSESSCRTILDSDIDDSFAEPLQRVTEGDETHTERTFTTGSITTELSSDDDLMSHVDIFSNHSLFRQSSKENHEYFSDNTELSPSLRSQSVPSKSRKLSSDSSEAAVSKTRHGSRTRRPKTVAMSDLQRKVNLDIVTRVVPSPKATQKETHSEQEAAALRLSQLSKAQEEAIKKEMVSLGIPEQCINIEAAVEDDAIARGKLSSYADIHK